MDQALLSHFGLAVGLITLLKATYDLLRFIDLHFLVPSSPLQNYTLALDRNDARPTLKEKEQQKDAPTAWALITGSSAGIGYFYANFLLSRGFNVIILAHAGVQEAHSCLSAEFPDQSIKGITFNCATASTTEIQNLAKSLSDLPITILINNVGGIFLHSASGSSKYPLFKDFEHADLESQYRVNATFATHLTLGLFPHLIRTSQHTAARRALVLNISSPTNIGMPYVSIYSATKAYMLSLSAALTRECVAFNLPIDCLAVLPGDTVSQSNTVGMGRNALQAQEFAVCALQRVDKAVRRGMLSIVPYWRTAIEVELTRWLPEKLLREELVRAMEKKADELARAKVGGSEEYNGNE